MSRKKAEETPTSEPAEQGGVVIAEGKTDNGTPFTLETNGVDPVLPGKAVEVLERETAGIIDRRIDNARAVLAVYAMNDIAYAEKQVRRAALKHEEAKKIASSAKASLDAAVLSLCAIIRDHTEPNLFNLPTRTPSANGHGEPSTNGEAAVAGDDAWRGETIGVLSLGDALTTKLHDASIHTLGDLQDFTDPAKHGGNTARRITDVKGIGAKAAEKIEEAMSAYWEKRAANPTAAPEADQDEADGTEGD